MDGADPDQLNLEWRYLKVRRSIRVDASNWREFVYLSEDMHEATIAVLVPENEPGTKRLAKSRFPGVG